MVKNTTKCKIIRVSIKYFTIFSLIIDTWVLETWLYFFTIFNLNHFVVYDIEHYISEGKNFMIYIIFNNNNDNNNNKWLIPILAPTRTCLNWLIWTGRYTVWRDKSLKATVPSFKFRLLDWRTGTLTGRLCGTHP